MHSTNEVVVCLPQSSRNRLMYNLSKVTGESVFVTVSVDLKDFKSIHGRL